MGVERSSKKSAEFLLGMGIARGLLGRMWIPPRATTEAIEEVHRALSPIGTSRASAPVALSYGAWLVSACS